MTTTYVSTPKAANVVNEKKRKRSRTGAAFHYFTLQDRESVIRVSQRELKSNSSMGASVYQAASTLRPKNLAVDHIGGSEFFRRLAAKSSASPLRSKVNVFSVFLFATSIPDTWVKRARSRTQSRSEVCGNEVKTLQLPIPIDLYVGSLNQGHGQSRSNYGERMNVGELLFMTSCQFVHWFLSFMRCRLIYKSNK